MHTASAAAIKGSIKGRVLNVVPRKGTQIRERSEYYILRRG
jgi:hypothetical protein